MGDTLYVNGTQYRDPLPRPTTYVLLSMSNTEKAEASTLTFSKSTRKAENSTFIIPAVKVQSVNDCRAAYRAILWKPENFAAARNPTVFPLYNPEGAKTQDAYNDDGEYGIGRLVRDTLH